jgi:hypothetical protein
VKRAIVLSVAAIASFAVTMFYLLGQRSAEPTAVAAPSAPRLAAPAVTPAQAPPVSPIATGYHDAPKVSGTRFENVEPAPVDDDDDAEVERRQLAEYAGGISNVAPVSVQQQRAILEAKLRHKKSYETVLRDSGLDREALSRAEREYAHQTVTRALHDYKEGFLQDVKPILSDEQFTLLSDYETTEFKQELERLQIAINSK